MENGDKAAHSYMRGPTDAERQMYGIGGRNGEPKDVWVRGMTKREAFAMAAMQGLLTTDPNNHVDTDQIASWSIECANALLKALEEE